MDQTFLPAVIDRPSWLASSLIPEQWAQAVRELNFTPQQAKIVFLILQGNRDKQIAMHLGLSVATVRTHLRQVFVRTGVADRVELLLLVIGVVLRVT